jgi:hypothetical protein
MTTLDHPLKAVVAELRSVVLAADDQIGEEIKWNAPSFFFTGPMAPFNPKTYKRHVVVFNLFQKNCIRLVFPSGSRIEDKSGLLSGDYADGRRIAYFSSLSDVHYNAASLQGAVRSWLGALDVA